MIYGQIGLGGGNTAKLMAACNGTEYLMAAFIPIFIIEKVGRRPLMLFGVRSYPYRYIYMAMLTSPGGGNVHLHGRPRRL